MTDEGNPFTLSAPAQMTPFLDNQARDKEGSMLFSKHDKEVSFKVTHVELVNFEGQAPKPALGLRYADGSDFLWPYGTTVEYKLVTLGFTDARDLIGHTISITTYQTGSPPPFDVGKKLVSVSEQKELEE